VNWIIWKKFGLISSKDISAQEAKTMDSDGDFLVQTVEDIKRIKKQKKKTPGKRNK
jgi:hypothetical protein